MSNKPTQYRAYEYTGDSLVYSIIEVDEILEKKDKEIEELKQKLENVQASMYADVVDANMENRRLKRALWIARADRAKDKQTYYTYTRGDGWVHCVDKWIEIERKCLKKAEEY